MTKIHRKTFTITTHTPHLASQHTRQHITAPLVIIHLKSFSDSRGLSEKLTAADPPYNPLPRASEHIYHQFVGFSATNFGASAQRGNIQSLLGSVYTIVVCVPRSVCARKYISVIIVDICCAFVLRTCRVCVCVLIFSKSF